MTGEEKAFNRIFEEYYPRLLRFAGEYVGDVDEAEDILQNVFLKLWQRMKSLQPDTNLYAYLLTMVKNGCMDFLKHRQVVERFATGQQTLEKEMQFNYHAISQFDSGYPDIETLERMVEKAISELPEQCRRVFELSRYDGLKYREIAEKMEISVKTVESHISNALKILRVALKDAFFVLFI
ncbi:MAG: RNA polymerase sigma-70 factor [Tannerella sp.]|jgi:RNA polymerase sigma-70 factor (ECF subfamily)|nr:RNA polymerase sigma-70 factor [Tannerella sp.]